MALPYDFTTGSLPSGVTASGGANGTRVNSSGNLVGASAPRFDYHPTTNAALGLLVEPSVTNEFYHSADIASWPAGGQVALLYASNVVTGPDGATSAGTLTEDTSTSIRLAGPDPDVVWGGSQIASFYAYPDTNTVVQLLSGSGAGLDYANFDLSAGTCSASGSTTASMEMGPHGFYRCAWKSSEATALQPLFFSFVNNNASSGRLSNYAGTGKRTPIWGVEYNAGGTKLYSHIPTAGAAVTRSADAISFTIPSGVTTLRYTFDDNTTQDVTVSAGSYTIPTNLNRSRIKTIADPNAGGGGGVTGTLAATEAADTFAGSGFAGAYGTLAATEAKDTFAASGFAGAYGTLTVTENQDTAAFAGGVVIAGTWASTEGSDVFAAAGGTGVTGTLAVTEAPDVFATTGGQVVTSGSLAVTEAKDTFATTGGQVASVGSWASTEPPDTMAASGLLEAFGAWASTEAPDAFLAYGTYSGFVAKPIMQLLRRKHRR